MSATVRPRGQVRDIVRWQNRSDLDMGAELRAMTRLAKGQPISGDDAP